jgi:hypothetical protein
MATELKKITSLKWRQFLDTEAGREGMLWLREQQPGIHGKGEVHEVVFSAGFSEGYKKTLDKISDLLAGEKKAEDKNLENP